jgi:hypothetical protein
MTSSPSSSPVNFSFAHRFLSFSDEGNLHLIDAQLRDSHLSSAIETLLDTDSLLYLARQAYLQNLHLNNAVDHLPTAFRRSEDAIVQLFISILHEATNTQSIALLSLLNQLGMPDVIIHADTLLSQPCHSLLDRLADHLIPDDPIDVPTDIPNPPSASSSPLDVEEEEYLAQVDEELAQTAQQDVLDGNEVVLTSNHRDYSLTCFICHR